MPKIGDDMEMFNASGNFQFSGVKIDKLEEDEYTLATIVVDISGSVQPFEVSIEATIKTIIKSCQNAPTSEKIMIRVVTFNSNVEQLTGFIPVNDINTNQYNNSINARGLTSLYDAIYSSLEATVKYGENLISQNLDVNGDVYIITDGDDNSSTMTRDAIKNQLIQCVTDEKLESVRTFLIGIDSNVDPIYYKDIVQETGMTKFIPVGDATINELQKLANYISQSISMQSQSLGSGGPSVVLNF
jgi:uncharacterized protein YegL